MPAARIREDYLRILRFFRFHARYGKAAPDKMGLAACKRLRRGLGKLSAERIRQELFKLLVAPRAVSDPQGHEGQRNIERVVAILQECRSIAPHGGDRYAQRSPARSAVAPADAGRRCAAAGGFIAADATMNKRGSRRWQALHRHRPNFAIRTPGGPVSAWAQ